MKILVTGHEGYIGAVLAPMLLARGHQLLGSDVGYFRDCLFQPTSHSVENLGLDVRDITAAQLEGFDAVIHLAGLSNDPLGNFDPDLTTQINQLASERLAKNSKLAGVSRFIFASSCSNYGASDGSMLDETAEFNPQTAYGRSKCNAETTICELADASFCVSNLRAGTVYGIAPRIRFDLVVNNLVAYATTQGQVLLKSDGAAWRPLVHVSDVARAYVATVEAPTELVRGESFNVGLSSENYQIIEVARLIESVIPGSVLSKTNDATKDSRNYRVNCDKIRTTLREFKPQWTLRAGIEELYQVLSKSPVRSHEFEGQRYNRLAHLRAQINAGNLDEELRRAG